MTGGRGDYHMGFLRYEEVPAHIAQKLIEAAKKDRKPSRPDLQPAVRALLYGCARLQATKGEA